MVSWGKDLLLVICGYGVEMSWFYLGTCSSDVLVPLPVPSTAPLRLGFPLCVGLECGIGV